MKVISVLNTKGGVGKSAVATHLAMALHRDRHSVLFIDSDPQRSSTKWSGRRQVPGFVVVGLSKPVLQRDIPILCAGYDYVIIDGAPNISAMMVSAVQASDIVLIPTSPSPSDIDATRDIVDMVKNEQMRRPLEAHLLLIRQQVGRRVTQGARASLAQFDIPVLQAGTWDRTIYQVAWGLGLTAMDIEIDGPASLETLAIKDELLGLENGDDGKDIETDRQWASL